MADEGTDQSDDEGTIEYILLIVPQVGVQGLCWMPSQVDCGLLWIPILRYLPSVSADGIVGDFWRPMKWAVMVHCQTGRYGKTRRYVKGGGCEQISFLFSVWSDEQIGIHESGRFLVEAQAPRAGDRYILNICSYFEVACAVSGFRQKGCYPNLKICLRKIRGKFCIMGINDLFQRSLPGYKGDRLKLLFVSDRASCSLSEISGTTKNDIPVIQNTWILIPL